MSKTDFMNFYRSFFTSGERFPDADRLLYYDSILRYFFQGIVPNLDEMPLHVAAALDNAFPNIDKFAERQQAGRDSGGRPKKDSQKTEKATFSKIKKQPFPKAKSDIEIDNEIDMDVELEKDVSEKTTTKTKKPKKTVSQSREGKTQFGDEVYLTDDQHKKLIDRFGEGGAAWIIERLDAYKASSGKAYLDDYAAMRTWVFEEYEKHRKEHPAAVPAKRQSADEVAGFMREMVEGV